MAYLFSLTDASLHLEIPSDDSFSIKRRIVTVDTLEGAQSRDLGWSAGDISRTIETELDADTLNSLASTAETGGPLGLTVGGRSYEVLLRSVESSRLPGATRTVKIDFTFVRRI